MVSKYHNNRKYSHSKKCKHMCHIRAQTGGPSALENLRSMLAYTTVSCSLAQRVSTAMYIHVCIYVSMYVLFQFGCLVFRLKALLLSFDQANEQQNVSINERRGKRTSKCAWLCVCAHKFTDFVPF